MSESPAHHPNDFSAEQPTRRLATDEGQGFVPYDENLLERARTQWQFGDWPSLAKLDRDTLQHHPDRAKLALLAAAGRLQTDKPAEAKQLIRLAQDWGIGKKLISQILIAGVHNSLGRIATLGNQHQRALQHFEASIATGTPGSDTKLLTQARIGEQIGQLGLNTALKVAPDDLALRSFRSGEAAFTADILPHDEIHQAWQVGRWDFLTGLDNAELVVHPNRAEVMLYAACGYQQLDDMQGLQRCTRLAQDWGCPLDKLKRYLAAGIHNTLALSDTLAGQYESAAANFAAALTVGLGKPKPQIVKNRMRRQLKALRNIDVEQVFDAIAKHLE